MTLIATRPAKKTISFKHTEALLKRRKSVVADGVGIFCPTTVVHAKEGIITDADGNELIDFGGGIAVLNAGHCPETVVKAIQEQAEKLIHSCFHVSTYEVYVQLCEKLAALFPHGNATKVMLTNTGAKAVENAIKIARQATKRSAVICFTEAFHGRSMMAMTLTSKINYKLNCGPFAPEVYRLPFPDHYHYGNGLTEEEFVDQELQRLENATHSMVAPDNIAAIIIELVRGEGGFNVAPKKYVEGLRKFCDDHGIVLIFDEVQSGFCRTGKWAAYQHYKVSPDISTWAKSMGSGMPIGCVIGKKNIMDAAAPGTIGGTYLGNPVCCAASLATIDFMEKENLNDRAVHISRMVEKRFLSMKEKFSCIGDVRGLGAMHHILKNGYSFTSQNQVLNALKLFYKKFSNKNLDLEKIERPNKSSRLPEVLSISEVEKIRIATGNIKHKSLLSIVYSAGLRIGEALNLKLSDIDSKRMLIRIENAKGRKDRYVPLSAKLVKNLREYYKAYKPKKYLFEGQKRGKYPQGSSGKVFNRAVAKAKITKKCTMHTLRYSYATNLLESGTDIRYIQELLGHNSPKTTMIYTHVSTQSLGKIKSPFDKLNIKYIYRNIKRTKRCCLHTILDVYQYKRC